MNSAEATAVGVLRREPYRLFFPLGVLLTWWGVLPWLTFGIWGRPAWPAIFHSIAQVQGFLACFVVGFLFTMIPRRTGTAPPSRVEVALGAASPVAITAAVWFGAVALSQYAWLLLLATLVQFLVRRFRSGTAQRRPPDAFVWIPLGLGMALVGTSLLGLYRPLGLDFAWHVFGQLLVVQGMLLSLIVGVGSMIIPLVTRRQSSTDSDPARPGPRRLHLLAAALLIVSFAVQAFGSMAWGHGLRAAVTLIVLCVAAGIHRLPTAPGLHRWLVWLSAWAIPVGFALAAGLTSLPQIGLHVVYLGGFGWMALGVGLHVTLSHGGRPDLAHSSPLAVRIMAVLLLGAVLTRGLVHGDPQRMQLWLTVAAGCYLAATLAWLRLAIASYQTGADAESSGRGSKLPVSLPS